MEVSSGFEGWLAIPVLEKVDAPLLLMEYP